MKKMGEWYCCNQILFVSRMYSLKCTYNFTFYVDECLAETLSLLNQRKQQEG
jgi:hypothetical protein